MSVATTETWKILTIKVAYSWFIFVFGINLGEICNALWLNHMKSYIFYGHLSTWNFPALLYVLATEIHEGRQKQKWKGFCIQYIHWYWICIKKLRLKIWIPVTLHNYVLHNYTIRVCLYSLTFIQSIIKTVVK